MFPLTFLEWWHEGQWHRIGWKAHTPKSAADLREHGGRLAARGGYYRLVQPSVYADAPPVVIHEYHRIPPEGDA